MEFNPLSRDLQPVVVLRRLTDEDINFYTKRGPKRRSYRKKKEGRKNLKDEQRVDFSYFEEYRRSRNSYLKKEERKKKSGKKKKKKSNTPLEAAPQNPSSWLPEGSASSVLCSNVVNKVTVKKRKKKEPTEKKKTKKPRMKFKRNVIASDSDCSVENYGIVYSGVGNIPIIQQHPCLGDNIMPTLPQNSFMQSALPFHNNLQSNVSSPNISPPCSNVMIKEEDILSALDCEPEGDFYKSVIDPKFSKSDEASSENGLFAFMDQADAKDQQYDFQVQEQLAQIISSELADDFSVHDEILEKFTSDDIVKESCDVVSKIMQDMDREYANRKKTSVSAKQDGELSVQTPSRTHGGSPVIINIQPEKPILPSGLSISVLADVNLPKEQTLTEDKEFLNDAGASLGETSVSVTKSKRLSHPNKNKLPSAHPDATSTVDSVVKKYQQPVAKKCQQPTAVITYTEQKSSKLVAFCSKCHLVFTPNKQRKGICEQCCKSDSVIPSPSGKKKKTQEQGKRPPNLIKLATPKKNPFLKRMSPLKNKKVSGFRSSFVNKLSTYDKSRLLCNNTMKKYHLKRKIVSDLDSFQDKLSDAKVMKSQEHMTDLSMIPNSVSVTAVSKTTTTSEFCNKNGGKQKVFDNEVSINKIKRDDAQGKLDGALKPSMQDEIVKQNCDRESKSGFTMKNIDEGLVLMSFPESDKELDFSLDIPCDPTKDKAIPTSDAVERSKSSNIASINQNKRDVGKEMCDNAQIVSNSSGVKDLAYQIVVPNMPMMVVAHYAKAQQSSDFHLSRVSYQKNTEHCSSMSVIPSVTATVSNAGKQSAKEIDGSTVEVDMSKIPVSGTGFSNITKNLQSGSMPVFPVTNSISCNPVALKPSSVAVNISSDNVTKLTFPRGNIQCSLNSELTMIPSISASNAIQIRPIGPNGGLQSNASHILTSSGSANISVNTHDKFRNIITNSSTTPLNVSGSKKSNVTGFTTISTTQPVLSESPIQVNISQNITNNVLNDKNTLNNDANVPNSKITASLSTDTTLVPYKAPTTNSSKSPSAECGSQEFSGTNLNSDKHKNKPKTAASLVLHELDAIAILSILDLDGNAQHSNNLLHNLFIKELQELQRLKQLYHETTEVDFKEVANMKCQAKMSRIKSLSIARALLKKYGQLSEVIEAVLTKPVTENSVPYDSVSASVQEPNLQQDFPLLRIPKLEKSPLSSDCCLYQKSSNVETPATVTSPATVMFPLPERRESFTSTDLSTSATVTHFESTNVKAEKKKNSSCMLSHLLGNGNEASFSNTLTHLSITPVSAVSAHLVPATTSALVPMNSSGYFNSSPSFSQVISTPVSSNGAYQNSSLQNNNFSNILTSQPNSNGISLTPIQPSSTQENIKGETTRSSCQLQNEKTALVPYNYAQAISQGQSMSAVSSQNQPITAVSSQVQPMYTVHSQVQPMNTVHSQLQHLNTLHSQVQRMNTVPHQGQLMNTVASRGQIMNAISSQGQIVNTMPSQGQIMNNIPSQIHTMNALSRLPTSVAQQMQLVQYRQILPSATQPNDPRCPNITVPFTAAGLAGPQVNANRSVVPMNFVRNTVASTNNLVPNPLRVQQVVLSNVSPVSVPQNSFAVTPYNYIMPQQSSTNLQVVPQQMSNVYAVYQQPSNPQAVSQPSNTGMNSVNTNQSGGGHILPRLDLMNCVVCHKRATMRCKQCAQVVYCNTECAKVYWHQRHKVECKPTSGIT